MIILLLQQAIEKYIKGYLIFHGWELKKIHDIETLLTEVIQFDKTFEDYLDFGRRLTAYYYESRYPPEPVPEISKQEIKDSIRVTKEIIAKLRKKVNNS